MSDLNDVTVKPEKPGQGRLNARTVKARIVAFALYYFWPVLPLSLGIGEFLEGVRERRAEVITMGASWVVVAAVGFLACHAVHRVSVNITQHRRPFTEKDHKFCHLAQAVAFGAVAGNLVMSVFGPDAWSDEQGSVGWSDMRFAQFILLIALAALLSALTLVHNKGKQLFEELEKGV